MRICTCVVMVAAVASASAWGDIRVNLGSSPAENRAAIQREIDAVSAAGGGRVVIPPGEWPTGSIELKSGVELHLEKGAVLKGSTAQADYNADDIFPENFCCLGEEWSGAHLVYAYKAHDIAITGEGVIDGNGGAFFDECQFNWHPLWYKYGIKLFPKNREWFRPGPMIAIFLSRKIRLEGVTLANTPCWTCHIRCSDGVAIAKVTIDADRTIANSDGFSLDGTRNVTVDDCVLRTGDDGFAIRASCGLHAATNFTENIVVRNCDISSCCLGVRLGIGTGTIRNVTFENCLFREAAHAVAYTPAWIAGGRNVYIEKTRFVKCRMLECDRPVECYMPNADCLVEDALFEDCEFESLSPSVFVQNANAPIRNVRFVRCTRKPLLKGLKVRQDARWFNENRARIRANADRFAEGNATEASASVMMTDCTPARGNPQGVLLLTFGGHDFDRWLQALPVFAKYDAHATFFISGEISDGVVRKMKRLTQAGHTVGLQGVGQTDAVAAAAAKDLDGWWSRELGPGRAKCGYSYVTANVFGYPDRQRTEETDAFLLQRGFERVCGLAEDDGASFPATELAKRRFIGSVAVGGSCRTNLDDLCRALKRAADNREVISFAARGIGSNAAAGDLGAEWLERILKTAHDLDLRIVGFDELPPP